MPVCPMPDSEVSSDGRSTARDPTPTLTLADVQTRLGLPARTAAWLERLSQPGFSARLALPDDEEAARLLEQLGVDPADRASTLAERPDPVTHPALWWIIDRLYRELLATMGRPVSDAEHGAGWPSLPVATGAVGQHLHAWAFLAILPHVRRYHAEQRVPDVVSQQSLADLGRAMAAHRQTSGTSGLGAHWALPLIFRGAFYKGLCRLDFDRHVAPAQFENAVEPSTHRRPPRVGDPVINLHMPRGRPLDPDACDESIQRISRFVQDRSPEQPVAFMCHTWLLDDQLAAYLPETSNIIKFQRRFRLLPNPTERADHPMLQGIFKRDPGERTELPAELLNQLPQDTTLQRAFVTHLRSGNHWFNRTGWFPI
jgi:GNAT-like C-terminal domain/N-acyltransferase N-terminal domain